MIGQRHNQLFRLTGICLAAAFLLSSAPLASQARSRREKVRLAQQALDYGNRLRADLEGTPDDKRSEKEYERVIYFYKRAYDHAPFSSLAADGLAAAAETYHDMGKLFGREYWLEAIKTYRFLRREYPHSRYRDDSLFNIAQIQHIHLKDLKEGLETYQEFLRRYPRSRYAATVKDRIQSIKAEQAAASKPKVAGPGDRVEVRNVRYWNTDNYTRVVVDLDSEVAYQSARIANPDRIFFDLFNTELSTLLAGKGFDVNEGMLNRIRVAENRTGVTRVVLEVKDAETYSVFSLPNPFRLVVDIHGAGAAVAKQERKPAQETAKEEPASAGETVAASLPGPPPTPQPTRDGKLTLSRALGVKVGRIVIDPGHGGHDTGTIGPTGLMEKDLVLDLSRRLGKLIEADLGAEVVYTREDDSFVPLENRIALANQKQADLFISIHANSSRSRGVRGVETFYLNFSSDPKVLELAARENALSQKSVHELQDLVRQITSNEKLDESRDLAQHIQTHLHQKLTKVSGSIRNRGVKRAPFVVLIGGNMPSILTEVAFLSNPQDEKLMKSPDGRQAVATALFSGMTEYLEKTNSLAFIPNSTAAAGVGQE